MEKTLEIAQARLEDMQRQRDELDTAITELEDQLKWGEKMLASVTQQRAAG